MENVSDDQADAVVDAETGFVPRVEGEENGIIGEQADAFSKCFSEDGGLEGARVCGMLIEESGTGLVEYLEERMANEIAGRENRKVRLERGQRPGDGEVFGKVGKQDKAFRINDRVVSGT